MAPRGGAACRLQGCNPLLLFIRWPTGPLRCALALFAPLSLCCSKHRKPVVAHHRGKPRNGNLCRGVTEAMETPRALEEDGAWGMEHPQAHDAFTSKRLQSPRHSIAPVCSCCLVSQIRREPEAETKDAAEASGRRRPSSRNSRKMGQKSSVRDWGTMTRGKRKHR